MKKMLKNIRVWGSVQVLVPKGLLTATYSVLLINLILGVIGIYARFAGG